MPLDGEAIAPCAEPADNLNGDIEALHVGMTILSGRLNPDGYLEGSDVTDNLPCQSQPGAELMTARLC